jgi:hypothetical protein
MTLRKRLAMQIGVYGSQMPYADPHTAAPALWALLNKEKTPFEVSVVPIRGTTTWRKGMEALAIALHRQEFRHSPTVNFGRMPIGFRKSSGNSSKLVAAGKRLRGVPCVTPEPSHLPGLPPVGPLESNPAGSSWGGHLWSGWHPLSIHSEFPPPDSKGLYRIRDAAQPGLLYIGEGNIASRLVAHWRKTRIPAHPQGKALRPVEQLECSWVINNSWHSHQRLELETDLIGSHLLMLGTVPPAQFIG